MLQYSGSGTLTPDEFNQGSYPVSVTIDCSTGTCFATVRATAEGLTVELQGHTPVALDNGHASLMLPDDPDLCQDNAVNAGPFEITAVGTTVTGFRDGSGSGEIECDDSTVQFDAFHFPFTATLVSGDVCFLTTCNTATPTPVATTSAAHPVDAGPSDASGPIVAATPSTFSTLATVLDSARPANVLWATAFTVVLVILVALPTHLLNSAVEKGTDRVSAWWRARRRPVARTHEEEPDAAPRKPFSGWPLAAAGVLAASLISSFVDPNFGINAASPRVFLSILASFVLDAVVGWFLVIWLVRRAQKNAVPTFTFAPATLLIVAAAVAFSRLTGFQPGIVFGLVAGVSFGAVLASQQVRVTLVGLAYGFAAAVVAWIGYSLLAASGTESFWVVFAQETLSAVAVGGIAALPIALIPLRGLAGFEVFEWNRVWWGVAYAAGLFGFFFVLMPMPFAWTGVPLSLGTWIVLYLLYAVIAVGTWLLVVKPWTRDRNARATEGSSP